MNLQAGFRAHAQLRAVFIREPCEYCGRRKCNKRALLKEWWALKIGDAPPVMIAMAEVAYLKALQECHGCGPFGLIREEDLVQDESGLCPLDTMDSKERT